METYGNEKIKMEMNRRLFHQGCFLMVFSVLMPVLINMQRFGIYKTLFASMDYDDGGLLLLSALRLVVMNVIRMVPHYLGVFLLNESIRVYIHEKRRFIFNVVLTIVLIALVYDVIYRIHGVQYNFAFPAYFTVGAVLVLSYMDLFSVNMGNKVLMVGTSLLTFQWLDVMPPLTVYNFGRGEISMDIKMAAGVMGQERLLTVFACCMFAAFGFAAAIQIQLLRKEHTLKQANDKAIRMEKEIYDMKLESLKTRNYQETQSLVHDLKSPLTTAQGLISLAEMMESNGLVKEYFGKISDSLSAMSQMISEILYENTKGPVTTGELMRKVLSQVSMRIPRERFTYINTCPEAVILGNQIRLCRAVVNLLNNGYDAIDKGEGRLSLRVEEKGEAVYITVEDNGIGMEQEELDRIWELGYSGKKSTGLGLAFVRQVIENHEGMIRVESEKGEYTRVIICLRRERTEDGEYKDDTGN